MHHVYLGLGSNIGNRQQCIADAIRLISERVGTVLRQSSLIETEPWGFLSDNQFLNGVILCETSLTPRQVLKVTQQIERELGRHKIVNRIREALGSSKKSVNRKYYDRPIDIDILLFDDLMIDEPDLKIPHPLMHERDFVMIPLNEIK